MHKLARPLSALLLAATLSGCHLLHLGVYKIDLQQGNVVDQKQLKELHIGMTPSQVRFVLGSPLLADPFHPDRWDYIYTYRPGTYARDLKIPPVHHRNLSLLFVQGHLAKIKGASAIPAHVAVIPLVTPASSAEKNAGVPGSGGGHDGDGS